MAAFLPGAASAPRRLLAWRRWSLWVLLGVLVLGMLATLVYLAARYEASQAQSSVERDAADAVIDIRAALTRHVQTLQALQASHLTREQWHEEATRLLRTNREWVRLEMRGPTLDVRDAADTPYRPPVFARMGRGHAQAEVQQACVTAGRVSGHAYARSHFVPQPDGTGLELMELCVPQVVAGQLAGYMVATYSLGELLATQIGPQLGRSQEISFTEPDGTRLAMHGVARRGSRVFTAQQLLDLPGSTLVLRMDSWRLQPDLFPNVLTALVTLMSIALVTVLVMLGHDMRRRMRVEQDLADALAFRKAMEDSLVTGLRARDLQGRTTYVNPAFCQMVGFGADELLGQGPPAPYWPSERADEYLKRQEVRLAGGHAPPRYGHESMFMRKDGTRFPVLIIEAPLINAHGLQTGWMSAVLDISEQRRIEELSRACHEQLQATARLATVGEMASLLSHELNQPLAAIASYATGSINLLQQAPAPAPEIEVAIARIAEQAERAGRVIKSVHDFVRRRDQARTAVPPAALLEAILPLVNLQARKLGVRVDVQLAPRLPQVVCDRTMVEQVLLNLARNAMQAMDAARV
ncbi:MAG TPA: PAS domain S-box protein, partial [Ramlibacter sp.]|nr:PAS domain S-box protein [Ramlibacter sp.]